MRTSTVGIKAYTGRKKERVESLKERAFWNFKRRFKHMNSNLKLNSPQT
jgi:hypothetical protein